MSTAMVVTDMNGNLSSLAFPTGIIVMWNGPGTLIPPGWVLCDGRNNTPDLQSKFVLGGNNAGPGGGSTKLTLKVDNIPAHTHFWEMGWGGEGQARMGMEMTQGIEQIIRCIISLATLRAVSAKDRPLTSLSLRTTLSAI